MQYRAHGCAAMGGAGRSLRAHGAERAPDRAAGASHQKRAREGGTADRNMRPPRERARQPSPLSLCLLSLTQPFHFLFFSHSLTLSHSSFSHNTCNLGNTAHVCCFLPAFNALGAFINNWIPPRNLEPLRFTTTVVTPTSCAPSFRLPLSRRPRPSAASLPRR